MLQARGITGRLVTYAADGTPSMSGDIDKLARWIVTEARGEALRLRKLPDTTCKPDERAKDARNDDARPFEPETASGASLTAISPR